MSIKEKNSEINRIIIVFFIAFISYCIISLFSKSMFTLPDELCYVEAARALVHGNGLVYNGIKSEFQKILYSILISPAFLLNDVILQIKIVGVINSALVASAVFPVYLLAKESKLSEKERLYICLFAVLFPEVSSVMTFMSESLYYPIWMWVLLLIYRAIKLDRVSYLESVALGIAGFLLYFSKEAGMIAMPMYFAIEVICYILKRSSKRRLAQSVVSVLVYISAFLIIKSILFWGMESSYSGQAGGYKVLLSGQGLLFGIYALLFYLTYTILSLYILPLFHSVRRSDRDRMWWFYLYGSIIGITVGTVYSITILEDYMLASPRLLLRYMAPLAVPVMIEFLSSFDNEKVKGNKKIPIALCIYTGLLLVMPLLNVRGLTDSCTLEVFRIADRVFHMIFSEKWNSLLFILMKAFYLFLIIGGYIYYKRNRSGFKKLFMIVILVFNIMCLGCKVFEIREMYSIEKKDALEMQEADRMLDELPGKKLLICLDYFNRDSELAVTYHDNVDTDFIHYDGSISEDITLSIRGASRKGSLKDYRYIMVNRQVYEKERSFFDIRCGAATWEGDKYLILPLEI